MGPVGGMKRFWLSSLKKKNSFCLLVLKTFGIYTGPPIVNPRSRWSRRGLLMWLVAVLSRLLSHVLAFMPS